MQVLRAALSSGFTCRSLLNPVNVLIGGVTPARNLSSLMPSGTASPCPLLQPPTPIVSMTVRNKRREHYPKPREHKRLRVYGFHVRVRKPGGRMIIFERILENKSWLAHGF